jgi:GNAT superfamily N-acetyltransferase
MEEAASFILRDARDGDREAIRDVTLAAYEQYATQMPAFAWDEYRNDIAETIIEDRRGETIVAEQDGAIVGSVLLYPAGTVFEVPDGPIITLPWPEVRLLAVTPSARGKGIGVALMRECIARARRAGAEELSLHTLDMMAEAIRMYERMGFERTPDTDHIPDPDFVVKGYRLDLT